MIFLFMDVFVNIGIPAVESEEHFRQQEKAETRYSVSLQYWHKSMFFNKIYFNRWYNNKFFYPIILKEG